MKINREAAWVGMVLRCDCGCEFQLEKEDRRRIRHYWHPGQTNEGYYYVGCPQCRKRVKLEGIRAI